MNVDYNVTIFLYDLQTKEDDVNKSECEYLTTYFIFCQFNKIRIIYLSIIILLSDLDIHCICPSFIILLNLTKALQNKAILFISLKQCQG